MSNLPDLKTVKSILRGLLISTPTQQRTVTELFRDYRRQEGTVIPFREFDFLSVMDFYASISDTVDVVESCGQILIKPVVNSNTAHMSTLVRRQKKKPIGLKWPPSHYFTSSNGNQGSWSPNQLHQNPSGGGGASYYTPPPLPDRNFSRDSFDPSHGSSVFVDPRYQPQVANSVDHAYRRQVASPVVEVTTAQTPTKPTIFPPNMQQEISQFVNEQPGINFVAHGRDKKSSSSFSGNQSIVNGNSCAPKHYSNAQAYPDEESRSAYREDNQGAAYRNERQDTAYMAWEQYTRGRVVQPLAISEHVKSRISKLLESNPSGIWCSQLQNKYREVYNSELTFVDLGYTSMVQMLLSVPELFEAEQIDRGDWLVLDARTPPTFADTFQANIGKLLATMRYGIRVDDVEDAYEGKFGEEIKVTEMGFDELEGLFASLDGDVVCMVADADGCPRVYRQGRQPVTPITPYTKAGPSILQYYIFDVVHPDFVMPPLVLPPTIVPSSNIEVIVGAIFRPDNFYIQLRQAGYAMALDVLMDDMYLFYKKEMATYQMPPAAMVPGLYVCCFTENEYHRSLVMCVNQDDTIEVKLVDYGNCRRVQHSMVYFLHKDFAVLPPQAVPCRCANLWPPQGRTTFTRAAGNRLLGLVLDKALIATVAHVDHKESPWMTVCLVDTNGADDIHINDMLEREGHATFCIDEVEMDDPSIRQDYKYHHLVGPDFVLPPLILPNTVVPSSNIEVIVGAIYRPDHFYIQLRQAGYARSFYLLMEDMNQFYKKERETYKMPSAAMVPGLYVCCFTENKYHRCLVMCVNRDDTIQVKLVDFGNCRQVQHSMVYFLHKGFAVLPAQAVACRCANLWPPPDRTTFTLAAGVQLLKLVLDKALVATVAHVDHERLYMSVFLVDTNGAVGITINDLLEWEGNAIIHDDQMDMVNKVYAAAAAALPSKRRPLHLMERLRLQKQWEALEHDVSLTDGLKLQQESEL